MAGKCFIIDEWIFHDLIGDNGEPLQIQSFLFLQKLKENCDHIAIHLGSPWCIKAECLKSKIDNVSVRACSDYFFGEIMYNPQKCQLVESEGNQPELTDDLKDLIPKDDLYLFEAYYQNKACALITTDDRLQTKVRDKFPGSIVSRSEFLNDYLR